MRKIPTVLRRDPDDMKHVLPEVTPGCAWVLAGEGIPTRKYDGTCVMLDSAGWWARREVKPGKRAPANFRAEETDPETGKTVGWEPIEQSGFARWFRDAVAGTFNAYLPGTYELCGPKINGNPEGFEAHVLTAHADAERLYAVAAGTDIDIAAIEHAVRWVAERGWEGLVWHHPDGRMAKLKGRDLR